MLRTFQRMNVKLRYTTILAILLLAAIFAGLRLAELSPAGSKAAAGADFTPQAAVLPASSQAGAPASVGISTSPVGRPLFARPAWSKPALRPLDQFPSKASRQILATASLDKAGMTSLRSLRSGQRISFPLGEQAYEGTIRLVQPDDAGWFRVGGQIEGQHGAVFFIGENLKTREWMGTLTVPESKIGFQIETTGNKVWVHKKPLDSLICAMPKAPGEGLAAAAAVAASSAPLGAIPLLDSRPSAVGVVYLDFDGENVTDPSWNGGFTIAAQPAVVSGSPITSGQIADVWARVSEDFRPFDVAVTTDRSRYDNAPVGHRALCVITPTDGWYPYSVGGVAFLRSYRGPNAGYSSTVPCWVFNNTSTSVIALTVSHEVGHMFNLLHDGTDTLTYYYGHDSGVRSWGPIMGAPWGRSVTTWSNGGYPYADNFEDDLQIVAGVIAEPLLGTQYIPDEAGNTIATAAELPITVPVNTSGVITRSTDVDYYMFKAVAGPLDITVTPAAFDPDLDVQLELYDALSNKLATAPPNATALSARLNYNISATGNYYLAIRGQGRASDVLNGVTGYSNYGSVGAYTITGTFTPLPSVPLFTVHPLPQVVTQGAKVVLTGTAISNGKVTYQWQKNDVNMPGKTASTLTFASVQPADLGHYTLIATNASGSTPSNRVFLDVRYKPVITQQPLPVKQTVDEGTSVSYMPLIHGTAPITYVWKKNGVVIPGETDINLHLGNVDWFDAGIYSITASNLHGSTTSTTATLIVKSKPIITVEPPAIKELPLGGAGSVTITAVGTAPLTYQWSKGGTPIPGATKATLAWAGTKPDAEGSYSVRVTNASGFDDSITMVVDVQDKPLITQHPATTVAVAADAPFTLECLATGTPPLSYQWQLNGVNVSGGNTSTFQVNQAIWTQQGTYRCVVTNAVGTAISKNAVVAITSPPIIIVHPQPIKIAKGSTGMLKVLAGGTPVLKYQWLKNSGEVPKATAASLALPKATSETTGGNYKVKVTSLKGETTSNEVTVVVEDPPAIVTQPVARTVGIGDDTSFSVVASGAATLTYQWQKNNVNLAGETGATLSLTAVQLATAGTYRVKVSNDVGVLYSAAVKLTVLTKPLITVEPVALALFAGDAATFSVKATGSPTLTYQWRKDGVDIPAAKSSIYKISPLATTHTGVYSVVVRNAVGSDTSNDTNLDVAPIPAPTITSIRPGLARAGDKVLLGGTDLRWTTGVTFNGKAASFVITRNTELILTVPAAATTGPLIVKTKGGTVTSPSDFIILTQTFDNDDFVNAKVFFGDYTYGRSDNTLAAWEPADGSSYMVGRTVWFHWRAPYTSRFQINSSGTSYHNVGWVYTGGPAEAAANLQFIGRFDNHFGDFFEAPTTPYVYVNASKDQDFYIKLDSAHTYSPNPFDLYPTPAYGITVVGIGKVAYSEKVANASRFDASEGFVTSKPLSGQKDWLAAGPAAGIEPALNPEAPLSGFIGGDKGDHATVAWLPTKQEDQPPGGTLRASVEFSIQSAEASDEAFTWALYDRQGQPAFTVKFDAATRAISTQLASTSAQSTGQVFVAGASYKLGFETNTQAATWRVTLDGVVIAEGTSATLPTETGALVNLGAVWTPGTKGGANGVMHFNNVVVSNEVPQ